jgi:hypothetical protein
MKPPSRLLVAAIVIASMWSLAASPSAAASHRSQLEWLEGLTMIVLDSDDDASLFRARGLIESYGGQIAILSPPSLLMGWVPSELHTELVGREHIAAIYSTEVPPGEIEVRDEQTRHVVTWFNRVVRGEYQEQYRQRPSVSPEDDPRTRRSDVRLRDRFDEAAYYDNLLDNGFDLQNLRDRGLLMERSARGVATTSERMMGTVATTLIFVESDGSGADPDTYTWTDQHVQDYIAGVNTGLAWWSSKSRMYNDCWVAFYVRYYPPTDPRCQQRREMVLHPSGDVRYMVEDVMANFGYGGYHMTAVDAFNTVQRATYGTEWSYTAFVAYNPSPAPDQLTDGYSAFAYRWGPYTFLLYRSYGWDVEQVFAHESGHIFGACDEYAGGCNVTSCTTVCANGVVNGNCEECAASVSCMMLNNSFTLCSYTDDHVGWQIVPCAPPPLTPPTADAVSLAGGIQGVHYDATITGSDFVYGAFADFGAGVTVTEATVADPGTLLVSISIDNDAVPGLRDVVVYNRDMQSSTIADGFLVMASTRHYVSPSGGGVFPYLTPADAATTIPQALGAAGAGDSLLVESTAIALASLDITEAVTLSGAWTGGFTGRDVVGARTTLDLGGNIRIVSGAGEVVIEGFILQNGSGSPDIVPTIGEYGGALKVFESTARIVQCEIRNCEATDGIGFSGGGGVFASGSDVTIEYCTIHDNGATYGGGVYLYRGSAVLRGNTIEGNVVAASSTQPVGGGIALEECHGVTLEGNTIAGNTGSHEGGGLWIKKCDDVVINGGGVSYNTASYAGGGLSLSDTCDAVLSGCELEWNTGLLGGGMYFSVGTLSVRHSLVVGNAAISGAALYIADVALGEVVGNTFDRNSAPSGAAVVFASSPVEVCNNVVVNSAGHGIQCSGGSPSLSYNDVWNSSGDDYNGCTGGMGAISLDPVFVDTALADYHLGVHSAAIDAGRPEAPYEDPDGSRGDMGWYGSHAFVMDQPAYTKDLTAERVAGEIVLRWSRGAEEDIDFYAVYCDSTSGFRPSADNFDRFVPAPDTTVAIGTPGDTVYYRVCAVDNDGYAGGYSNEAAASPATAVGEIVRYADRLYQNVPNPFNPTTEIRYELSSRAEVTLVVYDVGGRLVKRLVSGIRPAGVHSTVWDGPDERGGRVSSGVYFYRLSTPSFARTRKMIVLK